MRETTAIRSGYNFGDIIGKSPALREVLDRITIVAPTGKELRQQPDGNSSASSCIDYWVKRKIRRCSGQQVIWEISVKYRKGG